ncbi:MAG TPA: RpiB/LacA/LacB family sugar-phosphate isomerase [Pyrinomonadaceae bacterium]|nr:RpiB/LacA/LacB family sugar-phosphate isomerase [Pyrinomonadaceae bacterium]
MAQPGAERSPNYLRGISCCIGIATDHGGFELKEKLVAKLHAAGCEVVDFGAHQLKPDDDYPDFVLEKDRHSCWSPTTGTKLIITNEINGLMRGLFFDHCQA